MVGEVKPLRLKVQKSISSLEIAANQPLASVLVDTPAFHLDGLYDYLVPEKFSNQVVPGSLVKVPFGNQLTTGYVLSRADLPDISSGLKTLNGVLSALPIFSTDLHILLTDVATRYGTKVWDLIRSSIPERVAAIEKSFSFEPDVTIPQIPSKLKQSSLLPAGAVSAAKSGQQLKWLINTQPGCDGLSVIAEIAQLRMGRGQLLIVVPDEKDVLLVVQRLTKSVAVEVIALGSHLPKSERYSNFLKVRFNNPRVIVGTRSAIFSSLSPNSTIIILSDIDPSMQEIRAPGWNVRDVGLLRSKTNSIIFLSNFPSLESARLVEMGWLKEVPIQPKFKVKVLAQDQHRSHLNVIADGLKRGSVLVSTSEPGYINGFLCQKCRNRADCDCGGRLVISEQGATPTCSLCKKEYIEWKCSWCNDNHPWMIRRGTKRLAQEFGKSFPNVLIVTSTGDKRVDFLPPGKVLVIATAGCEPHGEYAAAALMDGAVIFNRTQLRSDERALDHWFRTLSMLGREGEIFASLESNHPVVQALTKANALQLANAQIAQRSEAHLPPDFRLATIFGPRLEVRKIQEVVSENALFEILGPIPVTEESTKLVLKCPTLEGEQLSRFIHDLHRLRSLKALPSLDLRMDPYEI
jgi:primosomal protein N' (replication factor Y)